MEAAWQALETEQPSVVTMEAIPFPSNANLLLLTPGDVDHDKKKLKFKRAIKRWHPDKFSQRFGEQLPSNNRDLILDRVKVTFQQVNEEWLNRPATSASQ